MNLMRFWKILPAIGILLLLCGCNLFKTKINLKEYVSYSYEGINGYTSMEVRLDKEGIRTDYGEKIDEKKAEAFNKLIESMSISVSKQDGLCNGDEITIRVAFDEMLCDEAGIYFTETETKVIVEGLEEGELLDLFQDVVVTVKGTAPLAEASIENKSTNEYIKGLTFTLDKTTGFKAGETLTVSCNADAETAKEYGYVFLNTTHSYKTDGMDAYVEEPEELKAEELSEVVLEAENTVISETEGSQMRMLYKVTGSSNYLFQYNKEWIDSIELYEMKLLTISDITQVQQSGASYNKLYVIFKAYVTNADHGSDGYFCFEYNNLIKKADGTLVIRHDNQNMRYLCDDDYNELMEKVRLACGGSYDEKEVNILIVQNN